MKEKKYFGKAPIILGVIALICSCSTTDFSRSFNNFMEPEKNLLEFIHEEINKPMISADINLNYDCKAVGGYYDYANEPAPGESNIPVDSKYKYVAPFNKNESMYVKYCGEIDRAFLSAYQLNSFTKKDNSKFLLDYWDTTYGDRMNTLIRTGDYEYHKYSPNELWRKSGKENFSPTSSLAMFINALDSFTSIPQDFEVYFRVVALLGMDFRFPIFPNNRLFYLNDYSKVAFQLCSRYIDLLQNYSNPYDFTDYLCTQLFFLEPEEYEVVRGEVSKRIFQLLNENNISLFKLAYDTKDNVTNVELTLSNETYQRLYTNLTCAVEDAYKEVAKVLHTIDEHDYIYREALNGLPKNFSCTRKVKVVDLKYVDYDLYFDYSGAKLICYYDSYNDQNGDTHSNVPIICNEMNQHLSVRSTLGGNNRDKVIIPQDSECA